MVMKRDNYTDGKQRYRDEFARVRYQFLTSFATRCIFLTNFMNAIFFFC